MGVILRKYGVAAQIDGIVLITRGAMDYKSNPTLAAGDVQISKDGGAFANIEGAGTFGDFVAVAPASGTSVQVKPAAAALECKTLTIRFVDQTATKEWEDQEVLIETYGNASAMHPFDLATATQKVDLDTIKTQAVTCSAGVTVNPNVGTTQPVNFSSTGANALVKSDLVAILATALTETAGYLAAGFKKFFNVATPVSTVESVNQTGDSYPVVTHADYGLAKLVRSTTPANTLDVAEDGSVVAGAATVEGEVVLAEDQPYYAPAKAGDEMDLVDSPNSTALSLIATAVWAASIRTLTSFGSLVTTIWSYASRTLTGYGLLGAGATAKEILVEQADGTDLSGVDVWVTSDSSGINVVASGQTDAFGKVTFYLDPGSYFVWSQKPGTNFTNPASLTVA